MKRLLLTLLIIGSLPVAAQQLTYSQFINRVMNGNLEYAAAQLNRSVAQADLSAAKRFTDPTLSAEYGNNSDWDIAMGQSLSFELAKSVSFGKRAARISTARHNLNATEAGLQSFVQNLRAEATTRYIDALLARELTAINLRTARNMQSIYLSDSLRHARGDISELDVMQTRLEANITIQEYYARLTEYRNNLVLLDQLMGNTTQGTTDITGQMAVPDRLFDLSNLLKGADSLRMDIAEQQHLAAAAQSELTLVRRERMPDIDIALGVNYNTRVHNEEAPAPEFIGYTVGIGIPLPFSSLNRGEVRSSQYKMQQAQIQTDIVRSQAQAEIIQAYNNYRSSLDRMSDYNTVILNNAQQVLEGKTYAYMRGETSLLEVINAQHTYNEIQQSYAECIHDCMVAWVELERAAGIWDIELN